MTFEIFDSFKTVLFICFVELKAILYPKIQHGNKKH